MPTLGRITCEVIRDTQPPSKFPEQAVSFPTSNSVSCYLPLETHSDPSIEHIYTVQWSIDPSLLLSGGLQVQIEVDGCQKGQPRCYEAIQETDLLPPSLIGTDDGLWAVPDSTRRRPWIMTKIKTTRGQPSHSERTEFS